MRRLSSLLLVVLAGVALAAPPLTEAEALRLGLAQPELAELSRARAEAAAADAIEAALWPNPNLELSRERTAATRETAWRLAQPIDLSGRRGKRQEAADHRIAASAADTLAWRQERGTELRRAFHDTLRLQEAQHATAAWVERFARINEIVGRLARGGEVSGYDRRRLERERQGAAARLAELRAARERSGARLAALIGHAADAELAGPLLPALPEPVPSLQARLGQRPDLAALAARAQAADADSMAARNNLPELTLGVGGKRVDDGALRTNGTLVSLSIPLPLFDRQQGAAGRATAQAAAARAEHALARRRVEGELLGLHRQATQLIAAAERYRREAVSASAELLRIAETAYRAGESTVLELLGAHRGALEAETTALDLEWKAREARIELDQLTGSHPQ